MLIQCSSISEVHGNIDTSPCRSNIQLQPKGNQGLAALVGLAHASRAGPSHPPRSWVGQDGSPEYSRRHQEMLQRTCMFIRLPSSLWPPAKHVSLPFTFFLAGGILLVHHHYTQDSSPLPLKPSGWQWWSFRVRANDGVWPKIYYELGYAWLLVGFILHCFFLNGDCDHPH